MPIYRVWDESGTKVNIEAADGATAAQEYIDGGDWGETPSTVWYQIWTVELDGDSDPTDGTETHRITVDPPEPACRRGAEHKWEAPHRLVGGLLENPGVRGHGRGVTIDEVCVRCGCGRRTDTWAQDRSTGEQGLESVTYTPGEYTDVLHDRRGDLDG
jgi:hypothetical protein